MCKQIQTQPTITCIAGVQSQGRLSPKLKPQALLSLGKTWEGSLGKTWEVNLPATLSLRQHRQKPIFLLYYNRGCVYFSSAVFYQYMHASFLSFPCLDFVHRQLYSVEKKQTQRIYCIIYCYFGIFRCNFSGAYYRVNISANLVNENMSPKCTEAQICFHSFKRHTLYSPHGSFKCIISPFCLHRLFKATAFDSAYFNRCGFGSVY